MEHFYKPPVAPPETHSNRTNGRASERVQSERQASAPAGGARRAARKTKGGKEAEGCGRGSANAAVVEASAEKTLVVQSPLYRVELSNRGAVVKTMGTFEVYERQKPPRPLDLVNDTVAKELGWPFSLVMADAQLEAKANSGLYRD